MTRRLRWLRLLAGFCGLLALAPGCATTRNTVGLAGTPSNDPELLAAEAITWTAYGRTDAPPTVRIVEADALTCVDPGSGAPGFPVLLSDGCACREGFTVSPWSVSVAWRLPWSDSALRHELFHAAQARHGIVDPEHKRPGWLVDPPRARELLREKGL